MDTDTLKLIGTIIAFLSFVFGFIKYMDSRERELSWKKTEFLFNQAKYIDNDKDIIKSVSVFLKEKPEEVLIKVYGTNIDEATREEYIVGFEKLFNFLDRLAHAYLKLNTLGKDEIANYGWYLDCIKRSNTLHNYCIKNGFKDVINLAKEIENYKYA